MGHIKEPEGIDFFIKSEPLDEKARQEISFYIKRWKEENAEIIAQNHYFWAMGNNKKYHLDFEVDKLTDSILNRTTGDSFRTEVLLLGNADLKTVTKKVGWAFDWKQEYGEMGKEVYKLAIEGNPMVIQGLVSLSVKPDHIFMNLLESAPFNRGDDRMYEGVAGNLVAFACKLSFQRGGDGYVAFDSKTGLIAHYIKTLGAEHVGGHRMVIDSIAATVLMNKYFKV